MNILVCIKQVPASSQVSVDPETGVLIRSGTDNKLNPYDEYALETALRLREKHGGKVTAITMGAPFSAEILREAYGFGADHAVLLTDRAFAGADVLATSFALSQAVTVLGFFDLIICGRQTTDGDTAQVGPALAEWLNLPHVSWVSDVVNSDTTGITVRQDMGSLSADAKMNFPCLITVEKDIYRPRLPSYVLLTKTRDKAIQTLTLADMPVKDPSRYGLLGSPTQVEKIFPPEGSAEAEIFAGNAEENAGKMFDKLSELRLLRS